VQASGVDQVQMGDDLAAAQRYFASWNRHDPKHSCVGVSQAKGLRPS
jgi:hypothetical protein